MRKSLLVVLGLGLVVALIAGVVALVLYLQGGSGEASAPVSAPALTAEGDATVFSIVTEESEVRFLIDEVLRGADFTVIGVTNQIAGDISVVPGRPADTTLGLLRINVRTLETDNGNRNRALRSFILRSAEDEFEFAEFETRELKFLPDSVTIGEPFEMLIVGDLRVAGAERTLVFDASVTLESEERLSGSARSTIPLLYADFGLRIPDVPVVSSVSDEVTLEIDFVAVAAGEA